MTALTDAQLFVPFKTTLVPTNGSGNPTATRTSTKTVEDNEGKVKTLKSGAVALAGARVIQNLFSASATLATQGVTVTARTYTVSFYGTGTITFSGAYAGAALVGTGVSDRVQRTFTATAGTLTCTVSGSCTNGQCEDVTGQAIQTAGEYVDTDTFTNKLTSNTALSAAPWTATRAVVTDNVYNNPIDSATTAANFVPSVDANTHYINATITYDVAVNCYKAIVYVYLNSAIDKVTLYPGGSATFAHFNITTLAVTKEANVICAYITDLGGGWYKLTAAWLPTLTLTSFRIYASSGTNGASSTAGDGIAGIGLYLPQAGSVAGYQYFDTDSSAVAIPDATMLGAQLDAASKTNSMLWCRDLTNAVWVKTNCTAAKTQIGVDGLANGCSLLTFTADNGTCFQTITTASTPACTGWKIKRATGTGSIYITRDGGATYTDVTSLINSGTFTLTGIENTSVLNPVVGFKGATASDAIIVDSGRNHSGTELCEDIFTTSAAVTRGAESLTYQTSGNFSDTAGTILATIKRNNWANGNGSAVGKASFGLLTSASNSGVQAADGTNTVSGAAGTPTGQRKIGARWSGSSLQAFSVNPTLVYTNGTAGSYDGSFNLATIAVMPGTQGYIRDLAIFNSSLDDAAIIDAWDLAINYSLTADAGSYSYSGIDATFVLARNLACDTGSYAYNGVDATLNLARNLACDPGAYAYTGISAALTITTPARLITVNYNTPGIIVDYNTYDIEVDA